jgi:GNAT superfamily N-acetyltransferase
MTPEGPTPGLVLRHLLGPADVATIVARHGALYREEEGFDETFADYVERPLSAVVRAGREADRVWVAERDGRFLGSIAMVALEDGTCQLRWFLVEPAARGQGLGARLMTEALAFAEARGAGRVLLWTVASLTAAARLYLRFGFRLVEERPARRWGREVLEQRYERAAAPLPPAAPAAGGTGEGREAAQRRGQRPGGEDQAHVPAGA